MNALKEDQGRGTNMSLFDEIRYSFCNMSRLNNTGSNSIIYDKNFDCSFTNTGTQTDEILPNDCYDKVDNTKSSTSSTQTEDIEPTNNNNVHSKCLECEKVNRYNEKLERDVNLSHRTMNDMQLELERYEGNLNLLEKFVAEGNERNSVLQGIVRSLESKISFLEVACAKQGDRLDSLTPECSAFTQTQWGMLYVAPGSHRLYSVQSFKSRDKIRKIFFSFMYLICFLILVISSPLLSNILSLVYINVAAYILAYNCIFFIKSLRPASLVISFISG